MPVQVSCPCGKQLRVPDDYVGKRVKCPSCGEPQLVKAAAVNGAAKKAAVPVRKPAAAPASPAVIKFQCDQCDKPMQARAEHAGKAVRCPGCQAAVTIPGPEEEVAEAEEVEEDVKPRARIQAEKPRAKAGKRSAAVEDDEVEEVDEAEEVEEVDEAEEEDRPRKKNKNKKNIKQGVGLGLWIGIGVAALLLIGGGVVAAVFLLGGGAPDNSTADLAMIPTDAEGFVTIRVGDFWKLPQMQEGMKKAGNIQNKDPNTEVVNKLGVGLADIQRVTVVGKNVEQNLGWLIISTSKPLDRKKVAAGLNLEATEKTHESKTYQLIPGFQKGAACFTSDKQLVVASNELMIKEAIDLAVGNRKGGGGKLDKIIAEGKSKKHFVAGYVLPPNLATLAKNAGGIPGLADLAAATTGMMTITASSSTIHLEMLLSYSDQPKSQAAKKGLDTLKSMSGILLMTVPPAEQENAKKTLNAIVIEQSGTDVKVKLSDAFKADDVGKAIAGFNLGAGIGGPRPGPGIGPGPGVGPGPKFPPKR